MFKFLKDKINKWVKGIKEEKVKEKTKEKVEEKIKKEKEEKELKGKEKREAKKAKKREEKLRKAEKKEAEKKSVEEKLQEKEEKKSILKKIKTKLITTKISGQEFEKQFEEFETCLAENNIALETIDEIKKRLKKDVVEKEIKKQELEEKIKNSLKETISSLLLEPFDLLEKIKEKTSKNEPLVIVFFGINGSGKTTTIAKLANLFLKRNLSCVMAASDTFRAASIEQLEIHAKKLNIKLIKHDYGTDPAAVAFDAIKYAKAKNIKVVLIDTAGRMHTSQNLLNEMEKICRVTNPDLRIFVAESITGNDAINQARNFSERVGIDGIILTKADVDERGGTAVSIGHITEKPILFLGTGQKYSDLEKFDKTKFLETLGL